MSKTKKGSLEDSWENEVPEQFTVVDADPEVIAEGERIRKKKENELFRNHVMNG